MVQWEGKIITSISHYFFIKTYNKIYIFLKFQSICSEAPLNRKLLLLLISAAKPLLELQRCFLLPPQYSLKDVITYEIPMVISRQPGLPMSRAWCQSCEVRDGGRYWALCGLGPSEYNLTCIFKSPKKKLPENPCSLAALLLATGGARSVQTSLPFTRKPCSYGTASPSLLSLGE